MRKKIVVAKNALAPAMGAMKQKVAAIGAMAQAGHKQVQKAVIKDMESVKGPAPGKKKPGGKK